MSFRTDRNNNPIACIVEIAKGAGLVLGTDFSVGDPFEVGGTTYHTAKLIGDPIALSIRIIDAVGYTTKSGLARWTYINIPKFLWDSLTPQQKKSVIAFHYQNEGGTEMKGLFS